MEVDMNKPTLNPPPCANCSQPAFLVPRRGRLRRGERVLELDTWSWQCPGDCRAPDAASQPYRFANPALLAWEEDLGAAAWLDHFGEPLPASQRPRRPEEQRRVRVPLLLSEAEADLLDRLRGERPRADFLRSLLAQAGAG
jgi:hypothetical protein